ncbi:putative O-methyltransferase [Cadophora sp. MPI-SDFR-AT-0126]|nr:putative O-methyltransferase [Leotiomycetes sp. MPI-SDFR-AT-0126]
MQHHSPANTSHISERYAEQQVDLKRKKHQKTAGMPEAPEDIVEHAYDQIAEWYLEWVLNDNSPRQTYTEKLLDKLPPSPCLLELGCGPGVPVLNMLLEHGAQVTANDISTKQVEMARARCPRAKVLAGNMTTLTFEAESFHGALSFYTLFHLPRSQLKDMLAKIYRWLKPGGLFVFNLAVFGEEEINGEMMGYGMFWSSYGVQENCDILKQVGFEVLELEKVKAGNGKLEKDDPDYDSEFLWVMARKPEAGIEMK